MTDYTLTIRHELCWGCKTCEVACKQEHDTPVGIRLIEVLEEGPVAGADGLSFSYRVNTCRHCNPPPCAEACPEEVIEISADGIVSMDSDGCTGCQSCMAACPYGAIDFDGEAGVALKCDMCYRRVENGLYPACADNICPAHCITFQINP